MVVVAAAGSAGATALGRTLAMPVSLSVSVCCLRLGLIGETETWGIYTGWGMLGEWAEETDGEQ